MAKKNFEQALEQLEKITQELESGDLSLEMSLKKFDEGMQLADFCNQKLSDAKKKVKMIRTKDGQNEAIPFDDGHDGGSDELSS